MNVMMEMPARRHSSVEVGYKGYHKTVLYRLIKDRTLELRQLVEQLLRDEPLDYLQQRDIQTEISQILDTIRINSPSVLRNTNLTNNPNHSVSSFTVVATSNSSNVHGNGVFLNMDPPTSRGSFANYHYNTSHSVQPQTIPSDRESGSDTRGVSLPGQPTNRLQLPSVKTLLVKDSTNSAGPGSPNLAVITEIELSNHSSPFAEQSSESVTNESSINVPVTVPQNVNTSTGTDLNGCKSFTHLETNIRNISTDATTAPSVPSNTVKREKIKKNQCHICGRICSRPSTLQTHLTIHTGDKPYICKWANCNKCFNVKSNMLRHFKRHECKSGVNPAVTVRPSEPKSVVI